MMLRCAIVDDEPLALGLLESYVNKTPFLQLAGKYSSAVQAMKELPDEEVDLLFLDIQMPEFVVTFYKNAVYFFRFLNQFEPLKCLIGSLQEIDMKELPDEEVDLLFLDIQMPELNGLEFSKMVDSRTRIVFTTAFGQYAIDGYRVNALDYLLKPISYVDFLQAANKALQWFELVQKPASSTIAQRNIIILYIYCLILNVLFSNPDTQSRFVHFSLLRNAFRPGVIPWIKYRN